MSCGYRQFELRIKEEKFEQSKVFFYLLQSSHQKQDKCFLMKMGTKKCKNALSASGSRRGISAYLYLSRRAYTRFVTSARSIDAAGLIAAPIACSRGLARRSADCLRDLALRLTASCCCCCCRSSLPLVRLCKAARHRRKLIAGFA